ncbi:MAG: LytTR family transcriptional regulator [Prevotella sp.]|nr:LytTR family DNA-binding domain-containing protein [Prevotella sp.]MCH4215200.1 LytTR family transcriptional regulator [Prevotella sp.]
MLRNPILYDYYVRRNYILLDMMAGFAYAFAFGYSSKMPVYAILADGMISSLLFYAEAVITWSLSTFSHLGSLGTFIPLVVNGAYCVACLTLFSGFELFIADIVYPEYFGAFVSQLVPRVFCQITIYLAFRGYYLSNQPENVGESLHDSNIDETYDRDNDHLTPAHYEQIERVTIRVGQKIKVIPVENIVFLKAEDDYVSIHTEEGHWLKSETMKRYETCLPQDRFVRVHRSYIVNLSKILKIERYGQKQLLQLSDGTSIRVSATGYKLLREKLDL